MGSDEREVSLGNGDIEAEAEDSAQSGVVRMTPVQLSTPSNDQALILLIEYSKG